MLSVSSLVKDFYGIDDVCLSLPTVREPKWHCEALALQLSDEEADQLRRSAEVLRRTTATLKLTA